LAQPRSAARISREMCGGVSQHGQKGKKYASHSNISSPDRSGRSALVGESLHPHGKQYQVNFERSRSDCRGVVAPECIWVVPLVIAYPCWNVGARR